MEIELFPHNRTAYEAAMDMIAKYGKAAVIHPTGTGKSMIAFQLALKHPNDKICWLAPSEYIYQTQVRSLADAVPGFEPQMLSHVLFMTYAKLMMHENELEDLEADWIICDEFHRAGSRSGAGACGNYWNFILMLGFWGYLLQMCVILTITEIWQKNCLMEKSHQKSL